MAKTNSIAGRPGVPMYGASSSATATPFGAGVSNGVQDKSSGKIKRVYHLHLPLVLFCAVSLLIAIGAFNSNNNLLFWLFSLALAMLMVSGVVSGQMLMGVRIERERTDPAEAGAPLTVRYRLTNTNRFVPVFALAIVEEPEPDAALPLHPPKDTASATPTRRGPESFCSYLPARSTITVDGQAPTYARGQIHLSRLRIISEFPFGIVRKSLVFTQPASIVVHPARLLSILIDRDTHRGTPAANVSRERLSRVGSGDEFHSLREYGPGDSPRMVAWRASARREATTGVVDPLVRQTAATPTQRMLIVLDLARATTQAEYERAISEVATLLALPQGVAGIDAVRNTVLGLWIPSTALFEPPAGSPRAGRNGEPSRAGTHTARTRTLLDALSQLPTFDEATAAQQHAASMPPIARDVTLLVVTGAHPPRRATADEYRQQQTTSSPPAERGAP